MRLTTNLSRLKISISLLRPQTARGDQITFLSFNKICQFLSKTKLCFATANSLSAKIFRHPRVRPCASSRNTGRKRGGEFSAFSSGNATTTTTTRGNIHHRRRRRRRSLDESHDTACAYKRLHGSSWARLGRRSNACNSHEWKIPQKLRMATTIICSSLVSLASRSHPIFPYSYSSNRSLLSCSNTLCLASPRLSCLTPLSNPRSVHDPFLISSSLSLALSLALLHASPACPSSSGYSFTVPLLLSLSLLLLPPDLLPFPLASTAVLFVTRSPLVSLLLVSCVYLST